MEGTVLWNKISCGLDSCDETANFGTRAVALNESEKCMYETITLGVVQPSVEGEQFHPPKLICHSNNSQVAAALNSTLVLFHKDFSSICLSLDNDEVIEAIGYCCDETSVFFVLKDSSIVFADSKSNKILQIAGFAETTCRESTGILKFPVIVPKLNGSDWVLYIADSTQRLFRITGITEESLRGDSPLEESFNPMVAIVEKSSCCSSLNEAYISAVCSFTVDGKLGIFWINSFSFKIWREDTVTEQYSIDLEGHSIKKVVVTPCLRYAICLTSSGSLVVISINLCIVVGVWDPFEIDNFSLISPGSGDAGICQLMIFSRSPACCITLIEFPGFAIKFTLPANHYVYLADGLSMEDNPLYIEADSYCTEVKFKSIEQSQPFQRFIRLLQRGKFDEAEQFANVFGLDKDCLYQSKVDRCLSKLDPYLYAQKRITPEEGEVIFDDLVQSLNKVKDFEFVVNRCISALLPEIHWNKKLIQLALQKLSTLPNQDTNLLRSVNRMKERLNLFGLLKIPNNYEAWLRFSEIDLLDECISYLVHLDVRSALMILNLLRYHQDEIDVSKLKLIISHPVFHLPTKLLFQWFESVISFMHEVSSDLMSFTIIEIAKQTRHHFTKTLGTNDNCKEGITAISQLINQLPSISIFPDGCMFVGDVKTYELMSWILKQLNKWIYLKETHNVIIPFDLLSTQHSEGVCEEIIFYLFDYVSSNGISFLVTDFVREFCITNNMNCDKVIFDYVVSNLNHLNWWEENHSGWEERYLAFANCIISKQDRIDAVLQLLKNAEVPWSETMTSLCEESLKNCPHLESEFHDLQRSTKKKIIWKKYDLLKDFDTSDTYLMLAFILMQRRPSFWEDMKSYAEAVGKEHFLDPYKIYVQNSFSEGDIFAAIDKIKNELDETNMEKMKKWIVCYINNFLGVRKEEKILTPLSKIKSLESFVNYFQVTKNKEIDPNTKLLKNALQLESQVEVLVQPQDLYTVEGRREVLVKSVYNICADLENVEADNKVTFLKNQCYLVTRLLDLPPSIGLLEIAKVFLLHEDYMTFSAIFRILHEEVEENDFVGAEMDVLKLAISVLKSDYSEADGLLGSFQYIQKVVTNAISTSRSGDLYNLLVAKDLLAVLDKSSEKTLAHNFNRISVSTAHQSSQFDMIIDLEFFRCLVNCMFNYNQKLLDDSTFHLSNTISFDVTVEIIGKMFCSFIERLPVNLHSLEAASNIYRLLTSKSLLDNVLKKKIDIHLKQLYSNNLLCSLSAKPFDLILNLSLLSYFQPAHAIKWLNNVSQRRSQQLLLLKNVAFLGKAYCSYQSVGTEEATKYWKQYTLYKWAARLKNFNLRFSDDNVSEEKLDSLLISLMKLNVSLDLIYLFCHDFGLKIQKYLLLYLEVVTSSWEPKYKENSEDNYAVEWQEVKRLQQFCQTIFSKITDMELLKNFLTVHVWPKVSWYYYEVFYILIGLLEQTMPKESPTSYDTHKALITFLQRYKRIRGPGEHEINLWIKTEGKNTDRLPNISNYRLPFIPFGDTGINFMTLLKPEMSLSVYKQWLFLPSWFNEPLDKNLICLYTIQNLKFEGISSQSPWELHSKHKGLLNEIEECIFHITAPEMATGAMYFVVLNVMPPGADKHDAIQRCHIMANNWHQTDKTENSYKYFKKVEQKYLNISTTHILYKSKLPYPQYLRLVNQPKELIHALYQDPSIVSSDSDNHCDINSIVDRISYLHDVKDLSNIKMELLMSWLGSDSTPLDDSLFFDTTKTSLQNTNNESLQRACYMMQGEDLVKACKLLLSFVFVNEDETMISSLRNSVKSNQLRMKALMCLMCITSPQQLENISGRKFNHLRALLSKLEVICQLEANGFYYQEEAHDAVDLVRVAASIIKNRPRSSEVALIVARIADLYADDQSIQLWSPIIESLCRYGLVDALELYLPKLTSSVCQLDASVLTSAWHILIKAKLKSVNERNFDISMRKILELLYCALLYQEIKLENCLTAVPDLNIRERIQSYLKEEDFSFSF